MVSPELAEESDHKIQMLKTILNLCSESPLEEGGRYDDEHMMFSIKKCKIIRI